ncbi:uncharacterized protein LOC111056502 isoform X2 [Nilaparvata lugens]|uniref:uncharacterized protein LOC111056502 isoform X2 n=1 Tax=Nilaparvata lugens TaxID=108931 RepID=UPI00193E52B9|nr:uncharacterized protein LOC111056502 isoform X2 [Nilaparvata lugens]
MINLNDFHVIRKMRNVWYRLLSLCKDDFYDYECESVRRESERLRALSKNNMKWFFRIAIPGIFVNVFMVMVVIPLARLYFNEQQKTDDTAFNVYLPLSVWSPFNSRTVAGFTFIYTLMLGFASNLLVILLVYISTIFYFYMELIIQIRILCFALQKHDERLQLLKDKSIKMEQCNSTLETIEKQAEDNYCITESLKAPILHYLKIREFFDTFQESSSFVFGLMLTVNMLTIVTISLLLTRSRQIQKSLYSINWYGFNSSQKKILNIFQIQTASKFLLMAAGLYEINLDTFIQVIQTAYSVFNVFKNLK